MSRLDAMAQHMWDARRARKNYANIPEELKPGSIAEAYQAQEVYHRLAEPVYGPVGGVKVATTTRVMQQLMGITHPCGGAIFARTIHASPARIAKSDFINLRIESEIESERLGLTYGFRIAMAFLVVSALIILAGIVTHQWVGTVTGGVLGGIDLVALVYVFVAGRAAVPPWSQRRMRR